MRKLSENGTFGWTNFQSQKENSPSGAFLAAECGLCRTEEAGGATGATRTVISWHFLGGCGGHSQGRQ
jgi:hypothetical protein